MPAARINLPAAARRSKARQGCWIFESSFFNIEKLSEKDESTRLGLYIFFTHSDVSDKSSAPCDIQDDETFLESIGFSIGKIKTRHDQKQELETH
ncbi:hypothetical protein N8562_00070 [bacterium]|nr:hypothetical protein [bacterium]